MTDENYAIKRMKEKKVVLKIDTEQEFAKISKTLVKYKIGFSHAVLCRHAKRNIPCLLKVVKIVEIRRRGGIVEDHYYLSIAKNKNDIEIITIEDILNSEVNRE